MKKIIFILCFKLLFFSGFAVGKNLKAILTYKTFYSAEKGPYVETYLSVAGSSVEYAKLANGKYQGKIEVNISFKLNNEVKYFDKYNLLSPEVDDTMKIGFNFIDEQRIQLNNGKYVMEISIADKNKEAKGFSSSDAVNIEYYPNIISVSDIELVDSYKKAETTSVLTKNGYEIVPFVNNFYPEEVKSLKFYAEFYNIQKVTGEDPVLVNYYIQSLETKRMLEKFHRFKKQNPQNMDVLLSEFPIDELPSGNYTLVIEIRNKTNDMLAFKEAPFQRSNEAFTLLNGNSADNTFAGQITNRDTLVDFIRSLRPISNGLETKFEDNQVKIADVKLMQNFFYDFWANRDATNPEKAWLDYYDMVKKVNYEYKALNKRGYETDRGRVYLQYGPPNTIDKEYRETNSYPYEIWHYYKIGTQSNKKFVFYNPDLVTNDFKLLHSDALGETSVGDWQDKLKYDSAMHGLEHPSTLGGFGNSSNQNLKDTK
jgi:GWxTD domain-containing protein